jgi:hypothetical protein
VPAAPVVTGVSPNGGSGAGGITVTTLADTSRVTPAGRFTYSGPLS